MTASTITAAEGGRLRFDRTVDRRLLHRSALSEVFLTDSAAGTEGTYSAGARLPASHAYFTDHLGHTVLDPLLLLECARQAETYGAHVHMGVGDDAKFVLRAWSMRLPGLFDVHGGDASEVSMTVRTDRQASAVVPPRSLRYDIALQIDDVSLGDVRIEVGYLSVAAYARLRTARRGTPPVSSDDVSATGANVDPRTVGRALAVNALLVDPVRTRDGISAGIRLPVDNASMFDHAQDHLPGMVLTEAVRQMSLLAGSELRDRPATCATMTGFDLAFGRFAELDSPTTITATPTDSGFEMWIRQGDDLVASGTVGTGAIPLAHRRAR